jgi:hypothetical protein
MSKKDMLKAIGVTHKCITTKFFILRPFSWMNPNFRTLGYGELGNKKAKLKNK